MSDDALFDMDPTPAPVPEPEPKLSADARRTLRQREAIEKGRHPLALAPTEHGLRRHPATTGLAYASTDPRGREYTCGTCVFRELHQLAKTYAKCMRPGSGWSHGPATDVRAFWPACTEYVKYQPTQEPTP